MLMDGKFLSFLPVLSFLLAGCSDLLQTDYMSQGFVQSVVPYLLENFGYDFKYTRESSDDDENSAAIIDNSSQLEHPWLEEHGIKIPDIDFDKYSLVIGRYYTVAGGYECETRVKRNASGITLYLKVFHGPNAGIATAVYTYFAELYPKLPDGSIKIMRWNVDNQQ